MSINIFMICKDLEEMSILNEQLLMSEITFGFELEAYVKRDAALLAIGYSPEEIPDIKFLDPRQLQGYLKLYFMKFFGNSDYDVGGDVSLGNNSFELKSPVYNLTPANIIQCIQFLYSLHSGPFQIYTDSTCGFHTHVSFPTITSEDVYWLECNLALDKDMIENLSSMVTTDGVKINFINTKYSSAAYLKLLKTAIKKDDFKSIAELMSSEKYRLIRNHPQGTLEWRGPRDFLNKPNMDDIKIFFNQLYKFCQWISKTLDKKEINGYDKKTFLSLIEEFEPSFNNEFKKEKKIDKIVDSLYKNPMALLKLDADLYTLIDVVEKLFMKFDEEDDDFDENAYDKFILKLTTRKLPEKLLTALLIMNPTIFKYSIQHQELPYKELGEYNPNYVIQIIDANKDNLTNKDIRKILEGCVKNYDYSTILNILSKVSVNSRKDWFDDRMAKLVQDEFGFSKKTVAVDFALEKPEFNK